MDLKDENTPTAALSLPVLAHGSSALAILDVAKVLLATSVRVEHVVYFRGDVWCTARRAVSEVNEGGRISVQRGCLES